MNQFSPSAVKFKPENTTVENKLKPNVSYEVTLDTAELKTTLSTFENSEQNPALEKEPDLKVLRRETNSKGETKVTDVTDKVINSNEEKPLPAILRPGFNIKDRIKSVNDNLDEALNTNPAYARIMAKEKDRIEKDKTLKQFYRYISFDNVSGVNQMIESGKILPETINSNDGLALRMVVQNGSTDMAKTLFDHGGNAQLIDPKQCYTREMADIVIQERYKLEHPVTSTLRESFGLGMPKPRFGI